MSDNHSHNCSHSHGTSNLKGRKLLLVALLNLLITLVQIIGGILSNSLSLLSDAVHNLGDSSAIFIAFFAGKVSQKKANKYKTFGYKRVEILAALFNSVVLVAICIFLFYEAYLRFMNPEPIKGKLMFIVATVGLLANLISVLVLQKDKDHNLNIKAAYLHLIGDTLSSVAVIISGIIIWKYNIYWVDPLITVLVGIYIIYHTWDVLMQTVDILMQATPSNIDIEEIKNDIEKIEEIENLHHIHIWKLDDTQIHLETHLNLKNNIDMEQMMRLKNRIEHLLITKYKISHTTLQMEYKCCNDSYEDNCN